MSESFGGENGILHNVLKSGLSTHDSRRDLGQRHLWSLPPACESGVRVSGVNQRGTRIEDDALYVHTHSNTYPDHAEQIADQAARVPPARIRAWMSRVRLRLRLQTAPRENCEGPTRKIAALTVFVFLIAIDDFQALAGCALRWLARDFVLDSGCIIMSERADAQDSGARPSATNIRFKHQLYSASSAPFIFIYFAINLSVWRGKGRERWLPSAAEGSACHCLRVARSPLPQKLHEYTVTESGALYSSTADAAFVPSTTSTSAALGVGTVALRGDGKGESSGRY
ncbi:hypothetical protein B0H11DRAFT_1942031 [Mycena galericulata]|nr:hypothetical protein B0H11DRAFT_1942031 [Mycena galericulata]